ncbi:hypothetical protein BDL97_19G068500 [Sphagnum fallax]|nr:hypothetical protein BDL97_19G068500 [Sphagnum fallax]
MSLGYLARRGPWSLQCLMSLSDGGWSRELRKSSPSCLLLPVQPLLVGLVEWGRRFEKNTLMGMQLGRRSILWLQQQWMDGSSGDACRSVLHFRFWQCECSSSLGKNCLRI